MFCILLEYTFVVSCDTAVRNTYSHQCVYAMHYLWVTYHTQVDNKVQLANNTGNNDNIFITIPTFVTTLNTINIQICFSQLCPSFTSSLSVKPYSGFCGTAATHHPNNIIQAAKRLQYNNIKYFQQNNTILQVYHVQFFS